MGVCMYSDSFIWAYAVHAYRLVNKSTCIRRNNKTVRIKKLVVRHVNVYVGKERLLYIELMWGYHPPGELVGFQFIKAYVRLPLLLSVYLL